MHYAAYISVSLCPDSRFPVLRTGGFTAPVYPSQFPARICVYGMIRGYIELFKNTLQNILAEFGIDYARTFIDQLVKRYGVADADVMAMVSVIYTGSARTKLETQLYREYIEEWRSSNRDYFISEITSVLVGDWRKKVLKKFEKDGI